jgi:hypothetical protein
VGPDGVVLGAVSAVADISVERAATRGQTEMAEVRAALQGAVAELDIANAELVRQQSFADAMLDAINVGT